MKQVFSKLVYLEKLIARVLIIALIAVVFSAAMSRAFGFPLPWSIELSQALFAWFVFLAASQATRQKAHMGVDMFINWAPKPVQKIVSIINLLLISGFLALLCYFGVLLSVKNSSRFVQSLGISYSFITISVSVGCFLMLISVIIRIFQEIIHVTKSE